MFLSCFHDESHFIDTTGRFLYGVSNYAITMHLLVASRIIFKYKKNNMKPVLYNNTVATRPKRLRCCSPPCIKYMFCIF